MTKIKVKIINNFRKTSSFGWRFVPKWKIEFIKLNGANAFEVLIKGKNVSNQSARELIIIELSKYIKPKYPDIFKFHNGIDFIGSDFKLLAIADGIIKEVETSELSGNYIKVEYGFNGVKYLCSYCHLKTHTPDIYGKEVSMGEWIAVMGNSGVTSTGIHCHLTVKEVATGNIINPENIFEFI